MVKPSQSDDSKKLAGQSDEAGKRKPKPSRSRQPIITLTVNNSKGESDGAVEVDDFEEIGQIQEKPAPETSRSARRRLEGSQIINLNYRTMNQEANENDS